jgi:ribosomal protein S18 acetylase RimI-like enzyme
MMEEDDVLLKPATNENVQEIHNLMREVYERLEDKSLYVCDDLEYVDSHISKEGFVVIACNRENRIVGSFIFRYPDMHEDNLGRDIGLSGDKLKQVVHMESSAVLPEYRGRSLQSEMLKYGEDLIDKKKYRYFMATVSPDNPASCKTFENNGYRCVMTKEKYGGLVRRVYLKE